MIAAVQLLAELPVLGPVLSRANLSDMTISRAEPRYVVKSVISLGRAGLYSRALPDVRLVLLLRHPCGVVASQLRGMKLGKLKHATPFQTISQASVGKHYGLTSDILQSLPLEEQIAWIWLVLNEHAIKGTDGQENVLTITHEALCADPVAEARRLFNFGGLSWSKQTEAFIAKGQTSERTPAYYDVQRNSAAEIDKWRQELSDTTIASVQRILDKSPLSDYFS
jgi:DNA polymerase III psi subunit